jgi:hypothetical protein
MHPHLISIALLVFYLHLTVFGDSELLEPIIHTPNYLEGRLYTTNENPWESYRNNGFPLQEWFRVPLKFLSLFRKEHKHWMQQRSNLALGLGWSASGDYPDVFNLGHTADKARERLWVNEHGGKLKVSW